MCSLRRVLARACFPTLRTQPGPLFNAALRPDPGAPSPQGMLLRVSFGGVSPPPPPTSPMQLVGTPVSKLPEAGGHVRQRQDNSNQEPSGRNGEAAG